MSPGNKKISQRGKVGQIRRVRGEGTQKVMYALFLRTQGPAIQVATPTGKSINLKFYKTEVLQKLKKYFKKLKTRNWFGQCQIST